MGYFHLSLFLFLVLGVCSAQVEHMSPRSQPPVQRLGRFRTECQIRNLNAVQPKHRIRSEAGITEFWDQNEEQFQCAGVAALRHRINQRGLLLPSFNNAPQLIYVVQGEGIQGAVIPGCAETYQSQSQSQSQQGRQQSQNDQHQKVRRIKQGDVIALPSGLAHWIFNNGESELVLVSLVDVANAVNQLDLNFRKFFLGGNPQEELVRGGQSQRQSREEQEGSNNGNNVLSGFDENLLQEVFAIDSNLVRKLQSQNDKRGAIVKVQREFEVVSPQSEEEEEEEQKHQGSEEEEEREQRREQASEEEEREQRREHGRSNGIEETFCTMKLRHQIDNPLFADIFNPRGGRITTVNNFNLPILELLQLSAERGVLYKNALYAPHWNINAHSVVYITRGNGRIQIVRENGDALFDDQVEEGQMIVVPQNFAVLKKAGNQGLEWIAFKTNANAKISQIAGRASVFRALPVDVLVNSYGVSREDAMRLKVSRRELSVFSPNPRSQHQSE